MIRCDICGSQDLKFLYHKLGYDLIRCKGCLTILTNLLPSEEEKKIIYGPTYYQGFDLTNTEQLHRFQRMKNLTFKKRLDLIETFKKPGRLLDLGTATGYFVEMTLNRGWQAYGVENSDYLAEVAKRYLGSSIFHGLLKDARYKDNFFDVVTILDVLEHLPYPREELVEIQRILKPDGLLFITTTNSKSPCLKILKSRWFHFNPGEHIYYFSPRGILMLLEQSGFAVEQIRPVVKVFTLSYLFMYILHTSKQQGRLINKAGFLYLLNSVQKITRFLKLNDIPISILTDEMMVIARNNK